MSGSASVQMHPRSPTSNLLELSLKALLLSSSSSLPPPPPPPPLPAPGACLLFKATIVLFISWDPCDKSIRPTEDKSISVRKEKNTAQF